MPPPANWWEVDKKEPPPPVIDVPPPPQQPTAFGQKVLDAGARDSGYNQEWLRSQIGLPKPRIPGNVDLFNRKVLNNPDGSVSTTSSISIGTDQGEVLIPTVIDGVRLSNEDAIKRYRQTGEHLGIFDTPENADSYATALHNEQARRMGLGGSLSSAEWWKKDSAPAATSPAAPPATAEPVPPSTDRPGFPLGALATRAAALSPGAVAPALTAWYLGDESLAQQARKDQGLENVGYPPTQYRVCRDLKEATTAMQAMVRAGDAVLFENDLPDLYSE